ncbi:MAG: hypothetical protein M3O82_10585 [Verrucomicrobiota bacterium]|nr:hypothetical protein [Verrucomicrobiota bacterium]
MKKLGAFFFLLALCGFARAQDDEPQPPEPGVRLQFVPPPMSGRISLGIYDAHGKLVRVLHREDETSEFTAAIDGLMTTWDGRDDSGADMPAGKYRARGVMVGELKFNGEAFRGNDWIIDEDSPRIRRIHAISAGENGGLRLQGETSGGERVAVTCDAKGSIASSADDSTAAPLATSEVFAADGKVQVREKQTERELNLPAITWAIGACSSRDAGLWVIDCGAQCEVKEFTKAGEFRRRLAVKPGDPIPWQISAAKDRDEIFVLENDKQKQRVTALALAQPPDANQPTTSTWEVVFQKTIWFSDDLVAAQEKLRSASGKPFVTQQKTMITLRPNPLTRNTRAQIDVSVAFDAQGSFLKLADGLPVASISDTPNLRWVSLGGYEDTREKVVFQSDGAAIEEFKVSRLSDILQFDCGEFEYDPAKTK